MGSPGSGECSRNLGILKETCTRLGMPLEEDKEEGPATEITFLGIELDTENQMIRLPDRKLVEILEGNEVLQEEGPTSHNRCPEPRL